MSYIGLVKVSTAILFKHLTQLVLQALMMMIPSKICLISITPPSTCPAECTDLNSNSTVTVDESMDAYVGFQRVLVQGLPNFRLSIYLTQ